MKDIFNNRQLSRIQAGRIARSQTDLGGKSQTDMAIALGGIRNAESYDELLNARTEAFNRLDALSQFIVLAYLKSESLEEGQDYLVYTRDQIQKAIIAGHE